MVLGNLIITLQSEKERAAYVTREISVEDKKVSVLFLKCMHKLSLDKQISYGSFIL